MRYSIQNFKGIYSSLSNVKHCLRRLMKINFVNFLGSLIRNLEDYISFQYKFNN